MRMHAAWMPLMAAAALALGSFRAEAKAVPATIFTDNMVLQQGVEVPVWGTADPGETVTVSFAGRKVEATAGNDGKWMVKLPPMEASSENRTLEIRGGENTVEVKNTLVGEVWLCSGQSNMEMPMWSDNPRWRAIDGDRHVREGADPLIRITTLRPHIWGPLPQTDFPMKWEALNAENGRNFSATAFYFGQELRKALNVPIGLVASHWSGTRIEPWTPPIGFDSVPELSRIAGEVNAKLPGTEEYRRASAEASKLYKEWLEKFDAAVAANQLQPPPPPYPAALQPYSSSQQPTVIFNRMIHPFVPFAFRGVIWYQGCSNLGEGMLYRHKMQALYNGWRKLFGNEKMPFFFVQLAPFKYGGTPQRLPELWEAQQAFAEANGDQVGMAVINDVGNLEDIHPHDKKTVGNRLARLALKRTYGKSEIKADAPILKEWKIENGQFLLDFRNVEQWVLNGEPKNFELSGADGAWYPARFRIDGTRLIVSSPKTAEPMLCRYMWNQTAEGNLFNEAGLPLGAFRCGREPSPGEVLAAVRKNTKPVYEYDLKSGTFGDHTQVRYLTDNSASVTGKITRIFYVVELTGTDGKTTFAVISMDPFTEDVKKIGVPTKASGAFFATRVKNLQVAGNAPNLSTGYIEEGNIEFWHCNYAMPNQFGVPGADGGKYDFGDAANRNDGPGYGSMQIHNFKAKQTIFAYNNFRAGANADIGLGSNPGQHPDWTFSGNGRKYSKALLYVFVTVE